MGCGSSSEGDDDTSRRQHDGAGQDDDIAGANSSSPRNGLRGDRKGATAPTRIGTENPVPDPNRRKGYLTQQVDSLEDYKALLRSNGIEDVDDPAAGHPVAPEQIVVISRTNSMSSRGSSLRSSIRRSGGTSNFGDGSVSSHGSPSQNGFRSHRFAIAAPGARNSNDSGSQYMMAESAGRTPAEEQMIEQLVSQSISLNHEAGASTSASTRGSSGSFLVNGSVVHPPSVRHQSSMSASDLVPVHAATRSNSKAQRPPLAELSSAAAVMPTWSPPASGLLPAASVGGSDGVGRDDQATTLPHAVPPTDASGIGAAGAFCHSGGVDATPYMVASSTTSPSSNPVGSDDEDDDDRHRADEAPDSSRPPAEEGGTGRGVHTGSFSTSTMMMNSAAVSTAAGAASGSMSFGGRRKSVLFSDEVRFVEPAPVRSKFPQYY